MFVGREALLRWYDATARDLPWRRLRDPYAIWLSEVMLQQTRVETVIPYFERFLARLPTLEALAAASDDEVLSLFSGLGYYRRARLLHAGVREAVARYGRVPEGAAERLALPGVGRYTAGAIGSIAFGLPEPIVDGNVARVFARRFGIESPLGAADTEKRLWSLAAEFAEGPRPGDANQALMELGATVCTKANPGCERCPWADVCVARANGRASALPVVRKKAPPRAVELSVAVLRASDGRIAMVRGEGALYGGLHGLPTAEDRATLDALVGSHFVGAKVGAPVGVFEHVLSHRKLAVTVHAGTVRDARGGGRLLAPTDLETVGVAALTRRALALDAGDGDRGPSTPPRAARSPRRGARRGEARSPADPSPARPSSRSKPRGRAPRA